jgi:sporulation protein YhbH
MTIVDHPDWDLSERGKKDAERHQEKIDEAIRKNVRDVISEESIITKKRGKKVRIPVKGLKDYRFKHGKPKKGEGDEAGAGQGDTKPGDVIGRRPKPGEGGKAGDELGEDYIEVEVDIDYLIQIMFEDLGLPWIEEKTRAHQLVPKGWKFESVSKTGILPRVHKKRTMLEALKREAGFIREMVEETNCSEDDARKALTQSKNDINDAIKIIVDEKLDQSIEPYVWIEDEDLRFKQIEEDVEIHSNAVVIAMMDTSGSMTTDKKYLCRSLLFWLVEFLKKVYDHVEIKFIVHTTEAKLVDEETFFHKGESGGTSCWTAFEKANYLIDTEYPVKEWNVYCVYTSDGEDFDEKKTIRYIEEMLSKKINMLSYNEIDTSGGSAYAGFWGTMNTLIKSIKEHWKFECKKEAGTEFCINKDKHFLTSVIKGKEHIHPTLKHILFKEEK